jgi:hypothetical protein
MTDASMGYTLSHTGTLSLRLFFLYVHVKDWCTVISSVQNKVQSKLHCTRKKGVNMYIDGRIAKNTVQSKLKPGIDPIFVDADGQLCKVVNHVLNLLITKTKVEINVQHIPVYHNVQKGNNTQACTHDE